jgi:hypothetical protein
MGNEQSSSSTPNLNNLLNSVRKNSSDHAQSPNHPVDAVCNNSYGYQEQQYHQNNSGNNYGLSPIEFSLICSYFTSIAGIDQKLDRQEFQMLVAKLYPNLIGFNLQEISNRAFFSINKSGNGYISIDEFIAAYLNLKKNPKNI